MVYRVHGLTFHSEIELPHWPAGTGACDAWIRHGDVPAEIPDGRKVGDIFTGRQGIGLLSYSQAGPILVTAGRDIVVTRSVVSPRMLRVVLSGTAMALLLHQRGRFCLHASSVVKDGRAILIAGASGAGKSTTAAALVERGAALLADDVTALDTRPDGAIVAYPGFQTLRLKGEAVAALPLHAQKPAPRDHDEEKHLIASPGPRPDTAFPVAAIHFLRRAGAAAPVATAITGVARVAAVERNLFRPRMARIVSDPRQRFGACTRIAQCVPAWDLARPESGFQLDALCATILRSIAV